jgi:transglutaminase-like putative cysteine protease
MTVYTVTHHTRYTYSTAVALCHNEARLLPRDNTTWQRCGESQVEISPRPALSRERRDFFGNRTLYFAVHDIHQSLDVSVRTEVETLGQPFSEDSDSPPWEEVVQNLRTDPDPEVIENRQFTLVSPFIGRQELLREYALPSFPPGRPLLAAALDLTRRIHQDFTYDPHFTTVATPLTEVLENRRGVCQDFAHLAIGCLRSLGLAARYMSGYIETLPPPGQPRLIGADASHAWLALYLPQVGWAEFDPTNDCMPAQQHIILAWGRDYGDVVPLKGVMSGGGPHKLSVSVDVAMEETDTT